jgi:predicted amidohydrolase YtcJ
VNCRDNGRANLARRPAGSIAVGKLADLAVLSKDYLTVPTDGIGTIVSLLTLVGGRIVHAAEPLAAFADPLPPD